MLCITRKLDVFFSCVIFIDLKKYLSNRVDNLFQYSLYPKSQLVFINIVQIYKALKTEKVSSKY